jgi:hypothetical protein
MLHFEFIRVVDRFGGGWAYWEEFQRGVVNNDRLGVVVPDKVDKGNAPHACHGAFKAT